MTDLLTKKRLPQFFFHRHSVGTISENQHKTLLYTSILILHLLLFTRYHTDFLFLDELLKFLLNE